MKTNSFLSAAIFIAIIFTFFACSSDNDGDDQMSAPSCVDKVFDSVEIGEQVWMAKNLNCNADSSIASVCYGYDEDNCDKYGRLYNWFNAIRACPIGWRLPTNDDWDKLYRFADGISEISGIYDSPTAGKYLKAASGWNSYNDNNNIQSGNGEDTYGFAALPGGYGRSGGSFSSIGNYGIWWTASEEFDIYAYTRDMRYNIDRAYYNDRSKYYLFSVRCLKD